MQALAREFDTTLLVYWVDRASTIAWVVTRRHACAAIA